MQHVTMASVIAITVTVAMEIVSAPQLPAHTRLMANQQLCRLGNNIKCVGTIDTY